MTGQHEDQTPDALWYRRLLLESQRSKVRWYSLHKPTDSMNLSRIGAALRLVFSLAGLRARGERNANTPVLTTLRFSFDNLPENFHGFRILHVSDLHFDGRQVFLDALCDLVHGMEADLCVLTGDYHHKHFGTCEFVFRGMERLLPNLNAKHGVVGILGNHDLGRFVKPFHDMGIRMLVNESLELSVNGESIWIVGVDDPHDFRCDNLTHAVREAPRRAFRVLLAHSPEIVEDAAEHEIDLYLCGHTHGGQICLPVIGPVFTNARCPRRYCHGVWRRGRVQGYTTLGAGTTEAPIRLSCPSEVALIELARST